jgi:hypothetical protein
MRRAALLGTLIALACAAPAAAWVELPPYPIPHDGVADCLRAAGPGQLTLLGHLSRTTSATDLLTVGPHGIARTSSTTLGWLTACAEAGAAPGVAPLLVGPVVRSPHSDASRLRVAVPGGTPATLSSPSSAVVTPPSVAVAPNGAAVVAWEQVGNPGGLRVLAAVRPAPNSPFGSPVTLSAGSPGDGSPVQVVAPVAGIDSAGVATILWVPGFSGNGGGVLRVATTAAGRFGQPQTIASAAGDQLALAVSPGGRTLILSYGDSDSLVAFERPIGASAFAPVPVPTSGSPDDAAMSLADDGSAVIAYHADPTAVFALVRRPGGIFGHERLISGRLPDGFSQSGGSFGTSDSSSSVPPDDEAGDRMLAALGSGGRVLVTWVDPSGGGDAASAHVAGGTLAGGLTHATRLGSPCRTANATRPLTLADGALAAAWTDDARVDSEDDMDTPVGGGLLHVAVPGATPRSLAPGLSAELLGSRAVHGAQSLRLRVRCGHAPCVVRAHATTYSLDPSSDGGDDTVAASSVALPRYRSGVLRLAGVEDQSFARRSGAPETISLLACSAPGTGLSRLVLHEPLRRARPRPLPRILDLTARRRGARIRVTWRTATPATGTRFDVAAYPSASNTIPPTEAPVAGRGRTHFALTLQGSPARRERTVSVTASNDDQTQGTSTTARIR